MKLFTKIFLWGTVVFSLVFLCSGYLFMNYTFKKDLEREISFVLKQYQYDKFKAQAGLLSNDELAKKILTNSDETAIKSLLTDIDVPVILSDDQEKIIYSEIDKTDQSLLKELSDDSQRYKIYKTGDENYILVGSPIIQNGIKLYFITKSNIDDVIEQHNVSVMYFKKIYGAALGAGMVLLFALAFFVTSPLKKMTAVANIIASGSYNERIKIIGKDEIGELAGSFNQMAGAVEERINELSDEAKRKEDFVANFSHELKTPLTSVIGYSDMIYQKEMSREETKQAAGFIWNEGMRLEALAHKMTDLIVLNHEEFMLVEMPAQEVIKDTMETIKPVLKEKNIEIQLKADEAYIKIEFDLFKTLLLNIIDNSIKADANKIELSGCCNKNKYVISIKDNGRGIPENELSRITEAFYMVDKSRSRKTHGAGIGLSLVSKIIKIHGGKLLFKSKEKVGTEVSFDLQCEKGGVKDEK